MKRQPGILRSRWIFGIALSLGTITTTPAFGQLIGNRTIGSPIGPSAQRTGGSLPGGTLGMASSSAPAAFGGSLQSGNNRFIRGNRAKGDFVGSNRTDQSGFVGNEQALGVGRVSTTTDSLKVETKAQRINRPLPPQPAKGMYYPRLVLESETPEKLLVENIDLRESEAKPEIVERLRGIANVSIAMRGRTAILRGTVDSEGQSELLERVLSFEPSVDRIQNELRVLNASSQ